MLCVEKFSNCIERGFVDDTSCSKRICKTRQKGRYHGIFTTALARLKFLLEGLLKKDDRILYMDTDSIIFMEYPNDTHTEDILTANVLGRWVEEITPEKHFETGLLRER